jgi:hypothetical protein
VRVGWRCPCWLLAGEVTATDDGSSSLSFALPEPEFVEFPLHSSTITGLVVSADGRFLFSSSDDGTIFAMGIPYPVVSRSAKVASLTASMSLPGCTCRAHAVFVLCDRCASFPPSLPPPSALLTDLCCIMRHVCVLFLSVLAATGGARASGPGPERLTWEPTPLKQFNCEVALVNRDEMEDALSKLSAMEKKLEEVKHDSEYLLHMKETQWAEKLNAVTTEMVCAQGKLVPPLSLPCEDHLGHHPAFSATWWK